MARTVNFDFTQGGGSVIADGTLTLSSTQNWNSTTSTVIPSGPPIELVGGAASIPNVEPTPTASDGWRYQVQLETPDRKIHTWIVSVPSGTTPIDFRTLPVMMSMTLPLGTTGVQLKQWVDSVHSHAAAANTNAVNALSGVAENSDRIDALESGSTGATGIPAGGGFGQTLTKSSNLDFDVKWEDAGGAASGSNVMIMVMQSGTSYTRPTSDPNTRYVFLGEADPGSKALENDWWARIT